MPTAAQAPSSLLLALLLCAYAGAENPYVVTWRAMIPPDPTLASPAKFAELKPRRAGLRIQLRRIESEIKLARAVLASHERRVAEYERFARHRNHHPLFLTLENSRLDRLAARQHLTELQRTRLDLLRLRSRAARKPGAQP